MQPVATPSAQAAHRAAPHAAHLAGSSLADRIARRAAGAIRSVVSKAAAGLSREAFNRRVVYRLSVLSDRELRDIGLNRYDVRDAASLTSGDAAHFLIARRDERRAARFRRYPG